MIILLTFDRCLPWAFAPKTAIGTTQFLTRFPKIAHFQSLPTFVFFPCQSPGAVQNTKHSLFFLLVLLLLMMTVTAGVRSALSAHQNRLDRENPVQPGSHFQDHREVIVWRVYPMRLLRLRSDVNGDLHMRAPQQFVALGPNGDRGAWARCVMQRAASSRVTLPHWKSLSLGDRCSQSVDAWHLSLSVERFCVSPTPSSRRW